MSSKFPRVPQEAGWCRVAIGMLRCRGIPFIVIKTKLSLSWFLDLFVYCLFGCLFCSVSWFQGFKDSRFQRFRNDLFLRGEDTDPYYMFPFLCFYRYWLHIRDCQNNSFQVADRSWSHMQDLQTFIRRVTGFFKNKSQCFTDFPNNVLWEKDLCLSLKYLEYPGVSNKKEILVWGIMDTSENPEIMKLRGLRVLQLWILTITSPEWSRIITLSFCAILFKIFTIRNAPQTP